MKTSFFKKIELYFLYRRIIKKLKPRLKSELGIEVDWLCRLHKVVISEIKAQDFKTYGEIFVDNMIQKDVATEIDNIGKFLSSNGLIELYGVTKKEYWRNVCDIEVSFIVFDVLFYANVLSAISIFLAFSSIISVLIFVMGKIF